MAAENGHEQVADLLLKHRAFVNAKSKAGISPVHFAAQSGHANLVKLLIDKHSAIVDALSLVSAACSTTSVTCTCVHRV